MFSIHSKAETHGYDLQKLDNCLEKLDNILTTNKTTNQAKFSLDAPNISNTDRIDIYFIEKTREYKIIRMHDKEIITARTHNEIYNIISSIISNIQTNLRGLNSVDDYKKAK
jgi:hypothetical protein